MCSTRFKGKIWGVDLADMGSLVFKNRGVKYLLCAIGILPNMNGLNLWKMKNLKQCFMVLYNKQI